MDLGDWALTALTAIIIGVISGIGTFFGLFRNSKREIYATVKDMRTTLEETDKGVQLKFEHTQDDFDRRIDKVESQIVASNNTANLQALQLNGLVKDYGYISKSLDELKVEGSKQTAKLDQLLQNGKH